MRFTRVTGASTTSSSSTGFKKRSRFCATRKFQPQKNELNARLAPFYNAYIFRKLKLGSYMRRQITEARLLSRFKKLFGGPGHGNRDRRLRAAQAPQVQGAGQGEGLPDPVPQGGLNLRGVPCGRVPNELPLQRVRRRVQDPGVREPATVSNRQRPATRPSELRNLLEAMEQGHERRVQHLEDCRARDSRRSATGLPHTSQSLTQWCYVGNHPTMIYAPHPPTKTKILEGSPVFLGILPQEKSSFGERKNDPTWICRVTRFTNCSKWRLSPIRVDISRELGVCERPVSRVANFHPEKKKSVARKSEKKKFILGCVKSKIVVGS